MTIPTRWKLDKQGSTDSILAWAKHGDMVIDPAGYRAMAVKFVCAPPDSPPTLIQRDLSGSGYAVVPIEVTRYLADPITFYKGALKERFEGIQLDTVAHQALLQQATGGRAVHPNRIVFYALEGKLGQLCIDDTRNPDRPPQDVWRPLNQKIPDEYLQAEPYTGRDLEILQEALKFKKQYESVFGARLRTLRAGAQLGISVVPNAPSEPPVTAWAANVTFESLDNHPDGMIVFARYEYTEVDASEQTHNHRLSLRFTPQVLHEYGRFQGVRLWVAELSTVPNAPPIVYLRMPGGASV